MSEESRPSDVLALEARNTTGNTTTSVHNIEVELVNSDEETFIKINDYRHFLENAEEMSHFRVQRKNITKYFHHFVVISVSETSLTVVHYSSTPQIMVESDSGIGKFFRQVFQIGQDISCPILDYEQGLYKVENVAYPRTADEKNKAYQRIVQRMNEREYNVALNNCESVVKYVLTGKSFSCEGKEMRTLADCCTVALIDVKDVGFKTSLIVTALGAIAGAMIRRAYVQVIVAALISFRLSLGVHGMCTNFFGKNIIEEAETRIEMGKRLPNISYVQDADDVIDDTIRKLNNSFVCNVASELALESFWKTLVYSFCVAMAIETTFLLFYVYFSLLPLRENRGGFLKDKYYCRIIFLRCFGGYLSITISIGLGALGQVLLPRPVVAFFFIVLGFGLPLRYALTVLAGFMFDKCCCKCCWRWSCSCTGNIRYCLIIVSSLFVIAIIAVTVALFSTRML